MNADAQRTSVSEYYSEAVQATSDLKTSACCPIDSVPEKHRQILAKVHPDVLTKFFGCGSPIPPSLSGADVLDLGCGTGRDVYLASALVGPTGSVVGVDMTDAQLDVARRHQRYHADALLGDGAEPNTAFHKGYIEDLASAGIRDASVDVVISNCVCNLSSDKPAVFSEVHRVLRDGGEFYFSDIYADRRLSEEARAHPVLVGECLGGALYIEDFRRILADVGLLDPRIMSVGEVVVEDPDLRKFVEGVHFYSITIRAFKIAGMEDRREDFSQSAVYSPGCCDPDSFKLDADFTFRKGVSVPVDANTAAILKRSRFSKLFTVTEPEAHRGLFHPEVESSFLPAVFHKSKPAGCPDAPANGSAGVKVPAVKAGGGGSGNKCC